LLCIVAAAKSDLAAVTQSMRRGNRFRVAKIATIAKTINATPNPEAIARGSLYGCSPWIHRSPIVPTRTTHPIPPIKANKAADRIQNLARCGFRLITPQMKMGTPNTIGTNAVVIRPSRMLNSAHNVVAHSIKPKTIVARAISVQTWVKAV
jgi:hypothetical protein